ncbi:alpha/beta hydrolase [Burkholderia guangdongensis]|uniref:PGAP1-like alpha/beta domain-containing protein n=1 Tax=Burkholderia guangdongensis TaxID=1792500 RepID=UPI0015CC7B06|nr:alpha/beta hydrolase [Burkholderia guangdongensis]
MPNTHDAPRPPSLSLMALEARAFLELQAFFVAYPLLRLAPRGDGHPVLVLPGLAAGDISTRPLRTYLNAQGYTAHGWKQGQNRGLRPGVEESLHARLKELADRYQRKVSVIGWSLGGIYARDLAHAHPDLVRQVITLGSPFAGSPRATNAWRLYEYLSGRTVDQELPRRLEMRHPPPVPATSIYSRTDGVVAWETCLEEAGSMTENIEVEGSHCGLGHHPAVVYAIADRLALPEGEWWPFDRNGPWRYLYPQRRNDGSAAEFRAAPAMP